MKNNQIVWFSAVIVGVVASGSLSLYGMNTASLTRMAGTTAQSARQSAGEMMSFAKRYLKSFAAYPYPDDQKMQLLYLLSVGNEIFEGTDQPGVYRAQSVAGWPANRAPFMTLRDLTVEELVGKIDEILNAGVNLNNITVIRTDAQDETETRLTPLIMAIELQTRFPVDLFATIKKLIDRGADVNLGVGDKQLETPLYFAWTGGAKDIAKELILAGAKVDVLKSVLDAKSFRELQQLEMTLRRRTVMKTLQKTKVQLPTDISLDIMEQFLGTKPVKEPAAK